MKKENHKAYSLNGEEYNEDCLEDAVMTMAESDNWEYPFETVIYEGDAIFCDAVKFFPNDIPEQVAERAYDNFGEWVDDWPNSSREQDAELHESLKSVFQEWIEKHKLQPGFYEIDNTIEIKVKILNEDGDFERLN